MVFNWGRQGANSPMQYRKYIYTYKYVCTTWNWWEDSEGLRWIEPKKMKKKNEMGFFQK